MKEKIAVAVRSMTAGKVWRGENGSPRWGTKAAPRAYEIRLSLGLVGTWKAGRIHSVVDRILEILV